MSCDSVWCTVISINLKASCGYGVVGWETISKGENVLVKESIWM